MGCWGWEEGVWSWLVRVRLAWIGVGVYSWKGGFSTFIKWCWSSLLVCVFGVGWMDGCLAQVIIHEV